MQADVDEWVVPEQFDSVAVYNAFNEHAYWGTATGAGVGWFSVSNAQDLSYNSVSMVILSFLLNALLS